MNHIKIKGAVDNWRNVLFKKKIRANGGENGSFQSRYGTRSRNGAKGSVKPPPKSQPLRRSNRKNKKKNGTAREINFAVVNPDGTRARNRIPYIYFFLYRCYEVRPENKLRESQIIN